MYICASFRTQLPALQPPCQWTAQTKAAPPRTTFFYVNNPISFHLLSLPLAKSFFSDMCTPAKLLASFKSSIAHNTSSSFYHLTSRCFTHIFFPFFLLSQFFPNCVFYILTSSVSWRSGLPSFPSACEQTLPLGKTILSISHPPSLPFPCCWEE